MTEERKAQRQMAVALVATQQITLLSDTGLF